jgi:hypothetical protein
LGPTAHVDSRAKTWRFQPDGVPEDHTPNHCSAPYSSHRSTSVNPSFAARRTGRSLAVWVQSTTGSLGSTAANQSSAADEFGGPVLQS